MICLYKANCIEQHAVGNFPTLKFLIQQGLDVTEIAEDKDRSSGSKTYGSHTAL